METKTVGNFFQGMELNYKPSTNYAIPFFEDLILEVINSNQLKETSHDLEESSFISDLMGIFALVLNIQIETNGKEANVNATETPQIHTAIESETYQHGILHNAQADKEEPNNQLKSPYKEFLGFIQKENIDLLWKTTPLERQDSAFRNNLISQHVFQVERNPSEGFHKTVYEQFEMVNVEINLEEFTRSEPEMKKINPIMSESLSKISQDNPDNGVKIIAHFDEESVNKENQGQKREVKAQDISADGFTGTVRLTDKETQHIERIEKPNPHPIHESKQINIRLEEGSVKFILLGDRLKLSMNLNENFYRQPTILEVQRLVQSLQNLGLNLEVLKLNGNSLYSSDHKNNAKKESREETEQHTISEFSEENTRSFSFYL